jgi:hypothetical protein
MAVVLPARAGSAVEPTEPDDAFPSTVSLYATSEEAASPSLDASAASGEVLRRPSFSLADAGTRGELPGKQSWWPVLYSALIPGAGELSMGYEKRGVVLIAAEVVAWTGYFINHDDGMQLRDDYEGFADVNWSQQKFIDDHPEVYPDLSGQTTLEELEEIGRSTSGDGSWPGYTPWTGKEEDKQHYYENIGKYDWFISGWADWDPDMQPRQTDLRTQYREMRMASNDKLDTANNFIYLSIAARVFSLVETTLLVRSARQNYDTQVGSLDNYWRFQARPAGSKGAVVTLEYRFK